MTEFRDNYIKAREIIAKELKEKYNLIESYDEYNCLTLDSSNFSIHLTFIVPDGDDVYISEKGKQWFYGKSYKDFLFERHPDDDERAEAIKKIFKGSSRKPYSFELEEIKFSFRAKLSFLKDSFPKNSHQSFLDAASIIDGTNQTVDSYKT